jgi:hypothetical protein
VFSLYCPKAHNVLLGEFVLHLVFYLSFSSKECLLIRERFLVLNRYCFDIFFMGVRTVDCYYGLAAPPYYSSAGSGPSDLSLRASSVSVLFECGLWSLESLSSSQQRLHIIRVRALVPRISFFGPAAPPYYSSAGSSPSNLSFWANSASTLLELGFSTPRIASFSHQRFHSIRMQTAVLRIFISGYQCSPLKMPESWWQCTSSDAVCQIRR